MTIRQRILALIAALLLVEAASYFKLSTFLKWTSEPLLAYTSALAFVGLLLASIIALGSEIPQTIRRSFILGGVWLFCVQAMANVLIAYEYGLSALPIEVVTRFFGLESEAALKAMALVQGATLSVVSISFWSVIAQLLRTYWDEQRLRREELQRLESFLQREPR